ncbi:26S proteasome non-ATPase regulatory subunit 10-like [Mytilus edulis]|uniref:26S proteasome non-ATPase regulatory subunit 10-like n=1 Tax=Mytilus edulis TaxID=6550 RepID=UPI0039EF31C6
MSPLSAAVKHGYREVGMLLLAAGSIFYGNSENILVLMKWAFYNDNTDIVPILTNVDPLGNAHGWIPLIAACINAQEEFVKSLLIQGANVNVSDENEMTPLTWACKFGHRNIITDLIANKANLNLKSHA